MNRLPFAIILACACSPSPKSQFDAAKSEVVTTISQDEPGQTTNTSTSAVCQAPAPDQVSKGLQYTSCDGQRLVGTLDLSQIKPENILTGVTIGSVQGSATPLAENCSAVGQTECTVVAGQTLLTETPKPEELCAGVSYASIEGTSNCAGIKGELFLGAYYRSGATRLTLKEAATEPPAINSLDAAISYMPDFSVDRRVNDVQRNSDGEWDVGVSKVVCGITGTVAERIQDCGTQHGALRPFFSPGSATDPIRWDGSNLGFLGEGSWTLVSVYSSSLATGNVCDNTCNEVWQDDRTKLLWSDEIENITWCHATGVNNAPGNAYAQVDPENICDNVSFQDQVNPISVCFEDPDELTTPAAYDPMKGNMRLSSGQSVVWRPVSHSDILVAAANGFFSSVVGDRTHGFSVAGLERANNANTLRAEYNHRDGFDISFSNSPSHRRFSLQNYRCVGSYVPVP